MKVLLLAALVAISIALKCDNPLLTWKGNQLLPKEGILKTSVTAPKSLPICKPLQGKAVCCKDNAWKQIKLNF